MRKQKKRQLTPKPSTWSDRLKVVASASGAIYSLLKIWEWVCAQWQHLPF